MKTTLPKRSLIIKERLGEITETILANEKDKIAMIILFGSYARGDWVQDDYVENHITYTYQSDLDILVIVRKTKYAGYAGMRMEERIKKRLGQYLTMHPASSKLWVSLIIEPITKVNRKLEEGRYFFSDIKKEGVLLYDNGEFTLSEAKELSTEERLKIARDDYEYWFKSGSEFLLGSRLFAAKGILNKAAFLLHQATESFYSAVLLVFSGYKPRLHDIEKLGRMSSSYHGNLLRIFPMGTHAQKECFELLKSAYVDARYDKDYSIGEEQLEYLTERVERLKEVVEEVCLGRLK